MKGAKKHFSRALTLLLSVLIMLQTVTVPAFAAENATENVEVATNDASTEEESTFNLINADVQIDDEYGNETDYISESCKQKSIEKTKKVPQSLRDRKWA